MPTLKQGKEIHGLHWGIRVGTEIVASTMIGLAIGFYLDRWLETRPVFLIIFAIFGIAAGFINLYHAMVVSSQPPADEDKS